MHDPAHAPRQLGAAVVLGLVIATPFWWGAIELARALVN